MTDPKISCCICRVPDYMPAEVKRFQLDFGSDDEAAFRILAKIKFATRSIKAYLDRLPENLRRHDLQCVPRYAAPASATALRAQMKNQLYDLRKHTEFLFDEAQRRNVDAIERLRMPHLYS